MNDRRSVARAVPGRRTPRQRARRMAQGGAEAALAANGNGVPRLECPAGAAGCEESHVTDTPDDRTGDASGLSKRQAFHRQHRQRAEEEARRLLDARAEQVAAGWTGRGPTLPPASAGIRGHGASRTAAPERRLKLANLSARDCSFARKPMPLVRWRSQKIRGGGSAFEAVFQCTRSRGPARRLQQQRRQPVHRRRQRSHRQR